MSSWFSSIAADPAALGSIIKQAVSNVERELDEYIQQPHNDPSPSGTTHQSSVAPATSSSPAPESSSAEQPSTPSGSAAGGARLSSSSERLAARLKRLQDAKRQNIGGGPDEQDTTTRQPRSTGGSTPATASTTTVSRSVSPNQSSALHTLPEHTRETPTASPVARSAVSANNTSQSLGFVSRSASPLRELVPNDDIEPSGEETPPGSEQPLQATPSPSRHTTSSTVDGSTDNASLSKHSPLSLSPFANKTASRSPERTGPTTNNVKDTTIKDSSSTSNSPTLGKETSGKAAVDNTSDNVKLLDFDVDPWTSAATTTIAPAAQLLDTTPVTAPITAPAIPTASSPQASTTRNVTVTLDEKEKQSNAHFEVDTTQQEPTPTVKPLVSVASVEKQSLLPSTNDVVNPDGIKGTPVTKTEATTPTKLATTPTKLAETPTKLAATPTKPEETPTKSEIAPIEPEMMPKKKDVVPTQATNVASEVETTKVTETSASLGVSLDILGPGAVRADSTSKIAAVDKNDAVLTKEPVVLSKNHSPTTTRSKPLVELEANATDSKKEAIQSDTNKVQSMEQEISRLQKLINDREAQLLKSMQENARLNDQLSNSTPVAPVVNEGDVKRLEKIIASLKKEKEEQVLLVQQLREEGEQFSKAELKARENLKKILQEKRSVDDSFKSTSEMLDATKAELQESNAKVTELTTFKAKYEQVKREADSLKEKVAEVNRALQEKTTELGFITTKAKDLVNDSRELTTIRKEKDDLLDELKRVKEASSSVQASLKKEISELRASLEQASESEKWKDENLRTENDILQKRIATLEDSLRTLTATADIAPVEDMQSVWVEKFNALEDEFSAARNTWKRTERELSQRIVVLEKEVQQAIDRKERSELQVKDLELELKMANATITSLENKIKSTEALVKEKDDIIASNDNILKERLESDEKTTRKEIERIAELESTVDSLQNDISALQKENDSLRINLEVKPGSHDNISVSTKRGHNRMLSADTESRTSVTDHHSVASPPITELKMAGGPNAMLRRYETFIASLQDQLQAEANSKNELLDSLSTSTVQNKELNEKLEKLKTISEDYEELKKKHNSALELLGEKTEKVRELQQDISEMKEIFHAQLQSLMNQLDKKQQRTYF